MTGLFGSIFIGFQLHDLKTILSREKERERSKIWNHFSIFVINFVIEEFLPSLARRIRRILLYYMCIAYFFLIF